MLDVAEKMLGSRASTGFRDDNAVAQLRRQLDHHPPGSDGYTDNPDRDTNLRAGSVERPLHALGSS